MDRTSSGVSKFDGTNWTTYTISNGLADYGASTIVIDAQGNKWFGTWFGGVSKFDDSKWTTYTTEDGLKSNTVFEIAIDTKNNKWFELVKELRNLMYKLDNLYN